MSELVLSSVLTDGSLTLGRFFLLMVVALILGVGIALTYSFRTEHTKSFVVTLALLPPMVAMVILRVSGSLGAGVAVAGTITRRCAACTT